MKFRPDRHATTFNYFLPAKSEGKKSRSPLRCGKIMLQHVSMFSSLFCVVDLPENSWLIAISWKHSVISCRATSDCFHARLSHIKGTARVCEENESINILLIASSLIACAISCRENAKESSSRFPHSARRETTWNSNWRWNVFLHHLLARPENVRGGRPVNS